MLIDWIFASTYHLTIFRSHYVKTELGWQFSDLFSDRWPFGVDMLYQIGTTADLNPYLSGRLDGYPPFAYVLIYVIREVSVFLAGLLGFREVAEITAFLLLTVMFFISWVIFHEKTTRNISFLAVLPLIFCYPAVFLIYRSNLDMLMVPVMLLFLWQYGKSGSGAIALGVLIAYKPQFGVLAGLYLIDRSYARLTLCAGMAVLLTAASLLVIQGPIVANILQFLKIQDDIKTYFGLQNLGLRYGHSFSNLYKLLLLWAGVDFNTPVMFSIYLYSSFLCMVAIFGLLYFGSTRYQRHERLTILVILMLAVPYWSYDYKLFVLIPLIFLFADRYTSSVLVLLSLVLIPKHFFFISRMEFMHNHVTTSSFLTPAILLICLGTLLLQPKHTSRNVTAN